MKSIPVILLSFSVAFLAGCAKPQYFFVESPLPKQLDGSFKFDDDTVTVVYSFLPNGSINMEITNKLDDLMYVDMEKSAMIFDSKSYTYYDGNASIEGSSSTNNYGNGTFSGTLSSTPIKKYIPPGSKVSYQFKKVPIGYKDLELMEGEPLILPDGTIGKKYSFSRDSENPYRNYLYLSDVNDSEAHVLNHDFWIANIVEGFYSSQNVPLNRFVRSGETRAVGILVTAGLIGVVIVAVQIKEDILEE